MNNIDVKIHHDGRVDLSLRNFDDYSYLDTSRTIELLLGNGITDRTLLTDQFSETIVTKSLKNKD
ncbi:MAG TPA: hypothetical protein ENN66_10325 [Proteobacteria bacterium]|nr:hypothetical protein [Pseudomonadota bacterium]